MLGKQQVDQWAGVRALQRERAVSDAIHWVRPSNLWRSKVCSAWLKMARFLQVGDSPSQIADEGSQIHSVLASCGKLGIWHRDELPGPEELHDLVFVCLSFLAEHTQGADEVLFEQPLTLHDYRGNVIMKGTADVVAIWQDDTGVTTRILVIDWKTGWLPIRQDFVYAQLGVYAAMAVQHYVPQRRVPTIADHDPVRVDVRVCQPRLHHDYKATFDERSVPEIVSIVQGILAETESLRWTFQATPEGCEHCPCVANCPAAYESCHAPLVSLKDDGRRVTVPVIRKADFLRFWPQMEKIHTQARLDVIAAIRQGNTDLGFTTKPKRGNRYMLRQLDAWQCVKKYLTATKLVEISNTPFAKFVDAAKRSYQLEHGGLLKDAEKAILALLVDEIKRGEETVTLERE